MKRYISLALCLCVLLSLLLTGCSKEVAVDTTGLEQITMDAAAPAMTKKDYTVTLTPAAHYVLPENVTVTVNGAVLTDGYTYDPATGALTVAADSITGDIAITATAAHELVGTWVGSIDLSQYMNDTITAGDASLAEYFSFTDIKMELTVTFAKDDVCKVEISDEAMDALIADLSEQMVPGMKKMVEDLLAAYGVEMDIEEYLAASGISIESLVEETMTAAVSSEALAGFETECNYLAEDGKLYFSDSLEDEVNMEEYVTYTYAGSTLTMEVGNLDLDEAGLETMFPLVLERAE